MATIDKKSTKPKKQDEDLDAVPAAENDQEPETATESQDDPDSGTLDPADEFDDLSEDEAEPETRPAPAPRKRAKNRIAVMLVRGNRYRHKGFIFNRGVPKIVSLAEAQYLVEQTGWFRQLKIDPKSGKPIMPRPKRKKKQRGRGRARIIGNESDELLYDQEDEQYVIEPDTEGEEGV